MHVFIIFRNMGVERVADTILGDEDTTASMFDADEDSWTASAAQTSDGAMVDTGKQDWCVHLRWKAGVVRAPAMDLLPQDLQDMRAQYWCVEAGERWVSQLHVVCWMNRSAAGCCFFLFAPCHSIAAFTFL